MQNKKFGRAKEQKELLLVSLAEEECIGAAAKDHAWHMQSSTCMQLELWSMSKKAKVKQEQRKKFGRAKAK